MLKVSTYLLLKLLELQIDLVILLVKLGQFLRFLDFQLFNFLVELCSILEFNSLDLLHNVFSEIKVTSLDVVAELLIRQLHVDYIRSHFHGFVAGIVDLVYMVLHIANSSDFGGSYLFGLYNPLSNFNGALIKITVVKHRRGDSLILEFMYYVLNLVIWLVIRCLVVVGIVIIHLNFDLLILEGDSVALIVCCVSVASTDALR